MQLVWDMDGTLLDSGVAVPAAYVTAVRQLGGPPVTPAEVVSRYWLGIPEMILADLLGRDVNAAEADVYYDQLAQAEVVPYPDAPAVLAALRARGHPVAIFTGTSSRAASMLLAAAGLSADVVVGGDLVQRPKPAATALCWSRTGWACLPAVSSTSGTRRTICAPHARSAASRPPRPGATNTTRLSQPTLRSPLLVLRSISCADPLPGTAANRAQIGAV